MESINSYLLTPIIKEIVHNIIYDELVYGVIKDNPRQEYKRIINGLQAQGAAGVVLGCTEIPLLIPQSDVSIPVFDTTRIHAYSAVDYALN